MSASKYTNMKKKNKEVASPTSLNVGVATFSGQAMITD
jgi:hypothetical protein